MTTLPAGSDLGGSPTQGTFKTKIQDLRTFIADLLGTDSGNKPAARAALGLTAVGETLATAANKGAARAAVDLPSAIAGRWGHRIGVNPAGDALPLIGPDLGLRNGLINGDFRLWQRGTSFNNPNGAYTADRWKVYFGSGNTVAVTRQAYALGVVAGEPRYFMRIEKTAGAGAAPEVHQAIEGVRSYAGKRVTVSLKAKVDAARTLVVAFTQNFGTGGSPSSAFSVSGATLNLTTGVSLYTLSVDIPSIAGKTLGSNEDDYLDLVLSWGTNANGTFEIGEVQIEEGDTATPFERRPLSIEYLLASRYYCKTYDRDTAPGTVTSNGVLSGGISALNSAVHAVRMPWRFPVPMRKLPSMTFYDSLGASGAWDAVTGSPSAVVNGMNGIVIEVATPSGTDGRVGGHVVADAEL